MLWNWGLAAKCVAAVAAAISTVTAQSTTYRDATTGLTFSRYGAPYSITPTRYINYGVAVPSTAAVNAAYDVVVQIAAPNDVGWAGLAWVGRMTGGPLTVAWPSGNTVVISSRYATAYSMPQPYRGATYTILRTGTHVNGTHWQVTAKCTGCTFFESSVGSGRYTGISPNARNRLAWAYASGRPSSPSNNQSSFPYHDAHNYWQHDFGTAKNDGFESLVTRNLAVA